MNPSKEEILKAVAESGYLFEQDVASIFENHNYFIQTNVAFEDIDEQKSREIDVTAFKRYYYDEKKKVSVSIRILCECKNNSSPFVFITRKKNEIDRNFSPPNFLFPKDEFYVPIEGKDNMSRRVKPFAHFKLDQIYPYSITDDKAVQFCKIIRKGKDWKAFHDGIYDSLIIPLVKCLNYFKKFEKSQVRNNSEWNNYIIYYPIVVLNSELYSINSQKQDKIAEQIDSISFIRQIEAQKIKGKYLIDFIQKEKLSIYLENNVESFVAKFVEYVTN